MARVAVPVAVGLLANSASCRQDLALAETATLQRAFLRKVLQEPVALMRQPELWVYANCESGRCLSWRGVPSPLSMTSAAFCAANDLDVPATPADSL